MVHPAFQITVGMLLATGLMTGLWLVQRRTRNAGIVDIAWAGAVGTLGILFAATGGGDPGRRWLAGVLVGLWSARLAIYLFRRVVGHPEEGRYAALRAGWGSRADRRFFRFFQGQAAAALVFALPILVIAWNDRPLTAAAALASVGIWLTGMAGLVAADRQLKHFKMDADNRGKTCRIGLWRYSRHPNYFFEWVHWWAYLPLALGTGFWWIAALVPLVLLYLLLCVTGIPLAEAQAVASRGEDYRRYQETTSPFVPWFPARTRISR
ncbi:MAG: DUF1295 domain-containing protein [Thermoguttaceae bacterium]